MTEQATNPSRFFDVGDSVVVHKSPFLGSINSRGTVISFDDGKGMALMAIDAFGAVRNIGVAYADISRYGIALDEFDEPVVGAGGGPVLAGADGEPMLGPDGAQIPA
ncbi:hypothetical protein [Streptacidiphilus sp. PAMC 29251]